MTKKELETMFAGYEEYVDVIRDDEIYVKDFAGFDEDWEENVIDLPAIVAERIALCGTMGVEVNYESAEI